MSDPVADALKQVDAGADHAGDLGGPISGEEPDARPEGPLPDGEHVEGADDLGAEPDGEQGARSAVLSWARSVPEGSHLNFDKRDWWDPDTGAENRIAYHLADATDAGAGYPNGIGILVGAAEMYWSALKDQTSTNSGSDTDASEVEGAEQVSREKAEGLV